MRTFAPLLTESPNMVTIVQSVRASDCGSECRGFESHQSPKEVLDNRDYQGFSFYIPSTKIDVFHLIHTFKGGYCEVVLSHLRQIILASATKRAVQCHNFQTEYTFTRTSPLPISDLPLFNGFYTYIFNLTLQRLMFSRKPRIFAC